MKTQTKNAILAAIASGQSIDVYDVLADNGLEPVESEYRTNPVFLKVYTDCVLSGQSVDDACANADYVVSGAIRRGRMDELMGALAEAAS